jgi:hypothetical protein
MIPWCGQLKILAARLDAVTKISSNEDSRKILLEILWQKNKLATPVVETEAVRAEEENRTASSQQIRAERKGLGRDGKLK